MISIIRNLAACIKNVFIVILFAWISFFPQTIQSNYWAYTRIFLVIFFAVLIFYKGSIKRFFSFRDFPLWIYVLFLYAGVISAANKNAAAPTFWYLSLAMFFIFYIARNIIGSYRDRIFISSLICFCGMAVACIGLLEMYYGINILYEKSFIGNFFYTRYITYPPRPMSTQGNPVVLGSFLLFCLPFNLYLYNNIKNSFVRVVSIFSFLVCLNVIILTFSRGVFLALFISVVAYLLLTGKKKIILLFFCAAILMVTVCSFQDNPNVNRFGFKKLIWGSQDAILSDYRFERVQITADMLKKSPLLGIGWNHFRIDFDKYYRGPAGETAYEFMIPDNMYLAFLAETGLLGTGGFLLLIISLIAAGLKYSRKSGEDKAKEMMPVLLTALIALLAHMGAYDMVYWENPYMLFCLVCGFIQGETAQGSGTS